MKIRIITLALILLSALPAFAMEIPDVSVHGFASQSYMKSSDNDWLADSTDGTTQLNEVGLTFSMDIDENFRIGTQLLSRDLGQEGNNEIRLDWGFGDYSFNDWAGIRIGKIKMPIGLYNEGRDSDFLRAMAFLPQSVYDEKRRNMLIAINGGSLYGNVELGAAGNLDYQLFYGETNFPDDATPLIGFKNAASMMSGGLAVIGLDVNNHYFRGGSLIYNTPLEGLRIGASTFECETEFNFTFSDNSRDKGRVSMNPFFVASLEYANQHMMLSSEYMEFDLERTIVGNTIPDVTSQGYYVLLTWYLSEKWSLSALYDVFYNDKDNKDGVGLPVDYLAWRKDAGFGVRYNVNDNLTLKTEYHVIDGTGMDLGLYNLDTPADQLEQDWDYFVVKASFNF